MFTVPVRRAPTPVVLIAALALAACDRLVIEAGTDPGVRARLAEAGPALIEVEMEE